MSILSRNTACISNRVAPMARLRQGALIAALAILPGMALAADAEPAWAGAPYEGTVKLHIALPGGKTHEQRSDASAQWVRESDSRVDLVLRTKGSNQGSKTDLSIPGSYADGGWRSTRGMIRLNVDANGTILGVGNDPDEQRSFKFKGEVTATRMRLEHQMTVGRAEGGLPAGAVVTYDYDLTRSNADAGSAK
ncbi:hypothetical protein FXN63_24200 [Pigmentiphaga aceris]|uniref:Uncharacterized protein n=1 Tax=Pigmentiphaga aceris TaxID=1940612 RepID=A0A5C0B792_9BURK|nr:hypothetical protein [Pigmentiphaga aceris]QEI08597.1 hypothetical protein FXN63_24200 [Pigmentiphaga aceris]